VEIGRLAWPGRAQGGLKWQQSRHQQMWLCGWRSAGRARAPTCVCWTGEAHGGQSAGRLGPNTRQQPAAGRCTCTPAPGPRAQMWAVAVHPWRLRTAWQLGSVGPVQPAPSLVGCQQQGLVPNARCCRTPTTRHVSCCTTVPPRVDGAAPGAVGMASPVCRAACGGRGGTTRCLTAAGRGRQQPAHACAAPRAAGSASTPRRSC